MEVVMMYNSMCMYRKFSRYKLKNLFHIYISTWCLGIPQGDTKPIAMTYLRGFNQSIRLAKNTMLCSKVTEAYGHTAIPLKSQEQVHIEVAVLP